MIISISFSTDFLRLDRQTAMREECSSPSQMWGGLISQP